MTAMWQYEELEETPGMGEIVVYETIREVIDFSGIRKDEKLRRVIARDVSRETWEAIQEAMNIKKNIRFIRSLGDE